MTLSLLPRPSSAWESEGTLTLTSPLVVACPDRWWGEIERFGEDLRTSVGWEVVRGDATDADLVVYTDDAHPDEGYELRVASRVDIAASSPAGLAYALTTLRQLGPADLWSREPASLEEWSVPHVHLVDAPAYPWRGSHLDVSRHFFGVDTVLRFLDLLAAHKLNRLHLHLNDDQGWRVEVPTWPGLTEVGAWRSGSPIGHENDDVRDDVPHGGFFSAEDLARIREHAAVRHITVVPEIDLPGHAQAVLAAYPSFGNTDEALETWTHWGISHHVLNVEEATLAFAEEVVTYVASLFPGSPVHIGGDECPSDEWAASIDAHAVMAAHGFTEPSQLQGLYTTRLAAALRREGHEVLAWDEVLDAAVPEGTVICAWRSVDKAREALEGDYEVIMAPMQYLYLDWLSSENDDEPVAVAAKPYVTTWEKVYGFRVRPEGLSDEAAARIRGAQVQLWTEYIDSVDRLDYMAFPRLSAFAEVVWGSAHDEAAFRPRLEAHLHRLDAFGVAYRRLDR